MKTIKINPKIRFYFVKNGIIFKINNYNTEKDACGIQVGGDEATKNILPSLTVTEGNNVTKYYLDCFIEDGDSATTTSSGGVLQITKFMKNSHNPEETSTYAEYYKKICEEEVKNTIAKFITLSNEDVVGKIKETVPNYMISGIGYTLTSSEGVSNLQINLTDEYIDGIREEIVKENIYNQAIKIAQQNGFTLTNPSDVNGIEITKN